jgi:hypothetical protein
MKTIAWPLAAALALGACSAQGPYELSLRLPQGKVLKYLSTTEQTIRQVLPGQTVTITQRTTTEYRFSVHETSPEGGTLLEVVYEEISLATRSPGGELVFDSRAPGRTTPLLRGMQALIGQGFLILVDRQGRIREVQGLKEMLEKARSASEASSSPAFGAAVERYFSPEAVEAGLSGFFDFYPDRKVLPGDSWRTERAAGAGLPMRLRNTWKLRVVRGGKAWLSLFTAILSEAPPERGGLAGTQEGSVEVELATGSLLAASTRQQLRGSLIIQGLPVPTEIDSTVTVRRTTQGSR